MASTITATQDPDNGDSRAIGDRVKLDWQGNVGMADGQTLVLGAETARDALHPGLSFGFPSHPVARHHHQCRLCRTAVRFRRRLLSTAPRIRYDDNSRFGNKITWRVAPAWVIATPAPS